MTFVLISPNVTFGGRKFLYRWMFQSVQCMVSIFVVFLFWASCSNVPAGGVLLPGGSGGGISSESRFVEGTFTSLSKAGAAGVDLKIATIVLTKEGKFSAYRTEKAFNEKNPDIEGTYEIVIKDIVFKNREGEEFQNRGFVLNESDTKFEWNGKFPGAVFVKK